MATISGIYAICNHTTGEAYIGQSRRMSHRWEEHRKALHAARHGNAALQAAWDSNGMASFGLVVLEQTTEMVPDNCVQAWDLERSRQTREAFWLARARAAGIVLYNDQVGRWRKRAA